jgi:hypothetical protein
MAYSGPVCAWRGLLRRFDLGRLVWDDNWALEVDLLTEFGLDDAAADTDTYSYSPTGFRSADVGVLAQGSVFAAASLLDLDCGWEH